MSDATKTTVRLLRPHARPQLGPILGVFVLGTVAASQATILALIKPIWELVLWPPGEGGTPASGVPGREQVGRLVDFFSACGDRLVALGWVDNHRMAVLVAVSLAALLLGVVTSAAQYAFTWLSRLVTLRMIVELRVRLARHLMGLSMRYHNQRRFGDLLSRVSSDVTTLLAALDTCLRGLVLQLLQALFYLGVAFFAAPWPTLCVALLAPLAALPVSGLTRKVRRRSTKSLTTLGSSVQALSEMFRGVRTVKAFGGEERELERYRGLNASYLRSSMRMVRSIALTQAWTTFTATAGAGLLVLGLGWATIRFGPFDSPGQMGMFFTAILMMNNNVRSFTRAWTRVQESVGAGVRISELLDEREDVVEASDAVALERPPERIVFEDVTFRYAGADRDAIASLSLEVRRGEKLALVGASGAGKTTLVDLVARFIDPTAGRVAVDGIDLRRLSVASWNAQYALVGQSPFLFHASIAENIRYGRLDATDEQVVEAARAANIHDFVVSLPDGYDTDVADMGERLSGGQRQRITIARALLKGASLLLLDEATSALDSESEAEVQRALERLMADRTVIVIAHRLATVRNADRIAVLEAGRLVELGTHEELVAAGGTYARLRALQGLGSPDETAVSR